MRVPDLDTSEAWPLAQDAVQRRLADDCQRAAVAQQVRRFTSNLSYDHLNWTQLLLPVYATWYRDDEGKRHPVYIHGQSGAVGGTRLASQRKGWKWAGITAAVALGIFLMALASFALAVVFPPVGAVGVVLVVLALLGIVGAIVPAVWPWQWNSRQAEETTDSHR